MLDAVFLKDSPIFKGFTPEQLETIGFVVEEVTIPNGHYLFKEGAQARSFFIVRDGEIEIVKEDAGKAKPLVTLGEGEIFGEMAVIRDTTRSTAARAKGHCSLYTIHRDKLDILRRKEPVLWGSLIFNVANVLADRLAATTRQLSAPAASATAPAHDQEKGFWGRLLGH